LAPAALAQARDKAAEQAREPAGYRAAIDAAIEELDLDHLAEAREHFARAHELFPNARTLRGLGVTDFELRRYVDAVREFEAALASDTRRLDGELRKSTEELLARAQLYVGEVQLALEPASATLTVDGMSAAPGSQGILLLEVGEHVLEFHASGRVSQRRPLRVRGQQRLALRVTLPALVGAEASPSSARNAAPDGASEHEPTAQGPRSKRRRVFTWILGGATLAASGTALGLVFAVENTKDEFAKCQAHNGKCDSLAEQGPRLERSRNAMIGVAGAFAVSTLVSFFVEGRARRSARVSLNVSPVGLRTSRSF
jgi:hypothetical protein